MALEDDQNSLVELAVQRISNGDFVENVDLPKEEKGKTVARLPPDEDSIKVLENKSTQSETPSENDQG